MHDNETALNGVQTSPKAKLSLTIATLINKQKPKAGNFLAFNDVKMQSKDKNGTVPKLVYRKTSAEIVSEARNSLLVGGSVKLVSTRRPITPNVNKRQLYGDGHPAGRPPSAFNLKYLQYETRALPCLGPINQEKDSLQKFERSGSLGTILESTAKTKLPALHEPKVMTAAGSFENGKNIICI